mmetsp:Transcript_29859/g.63337  ORF Transcript_29859/g.63337 Transcript_29859/m.63337 type:complete len:257 (-) Transcript_29859:849-1619(-)
MGLKKAMDPKDYPPDDYLPDAIFDRDLANSLLALGASGRAQQKYPATTETNVEGASSPPKNQQRTYRNPNYESNTNPHECRHTTTTMNSPPSISNTWNSNCNNSTQVNLTPIFGGEFDYEALASSSDEDLESSPGSNELFSDFVSQQGLHLLNEHEGVADNILPSYQEGMDLLGNGFDAGDNILPTNHPHPSLYLPHHNSSAYELYSDLQSPPTLSSPVKQTVSGTNPTTAVPYPALRGVLWKMESPTISSSQYWI